MDRSQIKRLVTQGAELFVEYVEAFYIHTLMPPLNEKYPLTHQVVSAAIKKINRAETA